MTAVALPRVKPRRRKRRPPTRIERLSMIGCVCYVVQLADVAATIAFSVGTPSVALTLAGMVYVARIERRCRWWRVVWNYVRHRYRDE